MAAYREIRRVLRRGGTFLFTVWNAIDVNECACVVTDAMSALYPEDPPVFLARTPHGHGSAAEIEADLDAAGFEWCALRQRDDVSVAIGPDLPAIADATRLTPQERPRSSPRTRRAARRDRVACTSSSPP